MSPARRTSLPRLADRLLDRPELDRRLSQWAPLTVVRGLRGYGKTTAVASWLERQSPEEVTAVWMTASAAVLGAESFESHLGESLRAAGVVVALSPPGHDTGGLAELSSALFSDERERRFVLVVDNFEHVRAESVLVELLSLLERHRGFYVLVCCSGHHPIESMAAGLVELNVIEPRDLLLGSEEILELARIAGSPVDRAGAERIFQAVGGDISMVLMVLRSGAELPLRHATVEDYVRTQLLNDITNESLMEHLMRFSCTEYVSWPLFRDLCGDPEPRRLLDDMEATGLVVRVDESDGVSFSMPTPIREMLHDHYSSSEPEKVREFHAQLAGWFAAHDTPRHAPLAFHHAAAAGRWDLAEQLWSLEVLTMVQANRTLLIRSLSRIPPEVLARHPSMQVLREISQVALADTDGDGRTATLRAFAQACARLVNQQGDAIDPNELLLLATGYVIELRLLGRLHESVAFADRVGARVMAKAATEHVNGGRLAWFHLQRGITFSLLWDHPNALRSYRRAWDEGTGAAADFVRLQAAANLALTEAFIGQTAGAHEWLDRHRSFDSRDWSGGLVVGIGAHMAAGLLALDRLDLTATGSALETLEGGSPALEFWPFMAYLDAQYALHSGTAGETLTRLDRLRAASEREQAENPAAMALVSRARADLLIACGRGEAARRLVRTEGRGKSWSRVPGARIRLLSGRAPDTKLDTLVWDAETTVGDRLELLLLSAVAALRDDEGGEAQRLMNQALDLYEESGILRPFATIQAAQESQLVELAGRDVQPDDAAVLARQSAVYPECLVFVELSSHEQSVLAALAKTSSRRAIADSLFVSVNTVKTQLASIYQKFGTSTRSETLARARELELLPPEDPE